MNRAALLTISLLVTTACAPKRQPSAENAGEPWASLRAMGDSLHRAAEVGAQARASGGDRENADGGRYLTEILLSQTQRQVFGDPEFPAFRTQYPETAHTGLVNPDNLYEATPISPGIDYLVRGTRGTTADVVFQVYEAAPGVKGSLQGISTLSVDEIDIAKDGNFEIHVGPTRHERNWLDTGETGGLLLIRWSHSDWATERAGTAEIVRLGAEGEPEASPDVAKVAKKLRAAGAAVPDAGQFWLDFVDRVRLFTSDNEVSAPRITGGEGLEGQVSAIGKWNLADDEALIVTVPKTNARYQGVQLGNYWFDALEWANRQTSLSGGQARLGSDGRYHYVIAADDPGVPNWLDTTGLPEGLFFLRIQGLEGNIAEVDAPRCTSSEGFGLRTTLAKRQLLASS